MRATHCTEGRKFITENHIFSLKQTLSYHSASLFSLENSLYFSLFSLTLFSFWKTASAVHHPQVSPLVSESLHHIIVSSTVRVDNLSGKSPPAAILRKKKHHFDVVNQREEEEEVKGRTETLPQPS